jgi:hypothetical protein
MTLDELLYLPECTAGVYAALEDEREHAGPIGKCLQLTKSQQSWVRSQDPMT